MLFINPESPVNHDIPNLALAYAATHFGVKVVDQNTMPPLDIQDWRDKIHYYFYPPSFSSVVKKVWSNPALLFRAFLHPLESIKKFYNRTGQKDPFLGTEF